MAKPWIEDAKEYEAIADLADSGVYQTSSIREYLDPENKHRTVLLAPKGCGKTLLIKYKRKMLQGRSGWELLPRNQLVSSPPYAPGFDNERMRYVREHPDYWSMLWQIAIALTVLRGEAVHNLPLESADLRTLWERTDLDDPFHIFVQLLNFSPSGFFGAERDFLGVLLPALSQRRRFQIGLFIDNVDECFGEHLRDAKTKGLYGQIAREFWHDAQIGLLMAARRIASYNNHIKVFATIRTEAFSARHGRIPDLANVRTHMTPIRFSKEDLRHIFEENIRNEVKDRLVEPDAEDPFARFFGASATKIRHPHTGKLEHIFDYIHRHTFGRPRDLMTVGREISNIRKDLRSPDAVRRAVNNASASIAASYLGEVSPHFDWLYEDLLFSKLRTNVLSADELADVELQYDNGKAEFDSDAHRKELPLCSGNGRSAFADMHAAGLLGIPQRDPVLSGYVQNFTSVFDMHTSVSRERRALPPSNFYILHNVIGSYVHQRHGNGWHPHSVNIAEPGGEWREDDDLRYVLRVDLCNSTQLRSDPILAGKFHDEQERALALAAESNIFRESVQGDSMVLADRNGYVLVRAACRIAKQLKKRLGAEVRAGLDFGPVIMGFDKDGRSRLDKGEPIYRATKLEASSGTGLLLTLPEVVERLSEYEVDWPFVALDNQLHNCRAKKVKNGWKLTEKGKAVDSKVYSTLLVLPLNDVSVE